MSRTERRRGTTDREGTERLAISIGSVVEVVRRGVREWRNRKNEEESATCEASARRFFALRPLPRLRPAEWNSEAPERRHSLFVALFIALFIALSSLLARWTTKYHLLTQLSNRLLKLLPLQLLNQLLSQLLSQLLKPLPPQA